jgi:uncharacterized membrane protein
MSNILKLLKTKTFWINLAGAALIVSNELSGKIIPTEAAVTISVFANLVIRLFTTKPVSEK